MNLLQYCFYFMFWCFGFKAWRTLAPQAGIKPVGPSLEGGFLTTGPPGESQKPPILHLAVCSSQPPPLRCPPLPSPHGSSSLLCVCESVSVVLESFVCFIYIEHHRQRCCSVAKSCPTLCDPTDRSTPGFPVLHCLPELAQTHVH